VNKPLSRSYPKRKNPLGDHIRKRRLDLNLLHREVMERFEEELLV
jgi:hypothetical protein